MNYYYDINLNFFTCNYKFYEWFLNDNIKHYKKVAIFQVSSKCMNDLVNNNIKVNHEFLEYINNKDNIALFADKNGVIALMFNNEGISIKRSFLGVCDEVNILDIIYTIDLYKLDYEIVNKIKHNDNLRINDDIKRVISMEVNNLIKVKDYIKLRYLYMEWFNKDVFSNKELVDKLTSKINNITDDDYYIYELIKLSYNKV